MSVSNHAEIGVYAKKTMKFNERVNCCKNQSITMYGLILYKSLSRITRVCMYDPKKANHEMDLTHGFIFLIACT